jgi:hypothetical protein
VKEPEAKDKALAALAKRRSLNQPKVIDNASLPAGSPMYYYCYVCDALVAVKKRTGIATRRRSCAPSASS